MADIDPVALTQRLVRCPSVTPADAGALDVLQSVLEPLGFVCRRLPFQSGDRARIDNLYARRGTAGRHLCFAGHTDVVPPGDPTRWRFDPFAATIDDGRLYGRGAADMKSGIAAFVAAVAHWLAHDSHAGDNSVSLLITGDEEGDSIDGTRRVLEWMADNGERFDACLVGEPSNPTALGDMIKIGRRGSLNARLTVHGVQGHAAYPQNADNPAHRLVRMLNALIARPLDGGTAHFEPSTLAVTSIDIGNPASNVIPAEARAAFNIRFNDGHSGRSLEAHLRETFDVFCDGSPSGGRYDLGITVGGESFYTAPGPFVDLVAAAVAAETARHPVLDTSGGTSDARFIKDYGPVVEFGLVSRTIHQVDEHAEIEDIRTLDRVYRRILSLFTAAERI